MEEHTMYIAGYQPLTLLDYPGKLAAVGFTFGCVLRCPFCHNPELVEKDESFLHRSGGNKAEAFLAFLAKRVGKLDGVCITGGEPTLHADLLDYLRAIKAMGFLVKLDTNGAFPETVRAILQTNLVDFWAMDIKHAPEKYSLASGSDTLSIENFRESVRLLFASGVSFEFRTTVVPGIHTEEDFEEIGKWIRGAPVYALQEFRVTKLLNPHLAEKSAGKHLSLERIRTRVLPYVQKVTIRR